MSSPRSHSKHCVAPARGRLFLAGRMAGGSRTVSVPPPGDTGTKSDGTDPRPGYSSAGWHPGHQRMTLILKRTLSARLGTLGISTATRQTVTVRTVCALGSMTVEEDLYVYQ